MVSREGRTSKCHLCHFLLLVCDGMSGELDSHISCLCLFFFFSVDDLRLQQVWGGQGTRNGSILHTGAAAVRTLSVCRSFRKDMLQNWTGRLWWKISARNSPFAHFKSCKLVSPKLCPQLCRQLVLIVLSFFRFCFFFSLFCFFNVAIS